MNIRCYRVGGYVRDRLLGLTPSDCDHVVVGATAAEMRELGFRQVGRNFPVFLHPSSGEEYALARNAARRFDASVTLEQDLAHRDLTINAMAMDEEGRIIDPYGGRRDLHARLLRHVGPSFRDDPLRVLRVARFAARLHFQVHPQTLELMRDLVHSGHLDELAPERVWGELSRALDTPGISRFIRVLRDCDALSRLFPEIDALFGVPQTAKHHPEVDTGAHLLRVLDAVCRLSDDRITRFAALVHDLGKGVTPRSEWPRHIGHEAAGAPLVRRMCKRWRIPNAYRDMGELVCLHHLECHRAFELTPRRLVKLFLQLGAFRRPRRLQQFTTACHADAIGRLGFQQHPYPQQRFLHRLLEITAAIDTRPFLDAGLCGVAVGQALHQARIHAVRKFCDENPPISV